jgi:hypothetical protein
MASLPVYQITASTSDTSKAIPLAEDGPLVDGYGAEFDTPV